MIWPTEDTPDPIDNGYSITTKYHDTNDAEIKAQTIYSVNSGEGLTITAPAISGYTCTGYRVDGGVLQNGSGVTLSDVQADHTIIFVYREISADPGDETGETCCCCCAPQFKLCKRNARFVRDAAELLLNGDYDLCCK